jgi:hypothetical protein
VNRDFLARWSWRLFMAIGVVILIVGAVMFVRTVRFVAEAEHATGTVVDLSRRSDSEGTVFYPVVRFVTANAEPIEFVSSSGSSPASESPGDRVEVLYDPDDPCGAQLSGIFHVWLGPAVLAMVGAGFCRFSLVHPPTHARDERGRRRVAARTRAPPERRLATSRHRLGRDSGQLAFPPGG